MGTDWSRPTKYIMAVALALLGVYVLYLSRPVIPLLILAALLAVIVRPLINWLHHGVRLPRGLAVAIAYLLLVFIIPLALLLAVPAIVNAVNYVISLDYQAIFQDTREWLLASLTSIQEAQLPVAALDAYVDQLSGALIEALQQVTPAEAPESPPVSDILQSLGGALTATFGAAAGLVGTVVSQIALLIFMFLASIHISLSAHRYRDAFLELAPAAYRAEFDLLLERIVRMWSAFFKGQLTLMMLIGILSWLGLTVLGVPGALSLGIIAGLLELIPNIGPVLAAIPAVIVALLQGSTHLALGNLTIAFIVIAFYMLLQQVENNFIVPRVLGGAVELPPLIVISGVLVGASVAGILGTLLATPVIASAREVLRYIYNKLQGKDPFPPEEMAKEVDEKPPSWMQQVLERLVQQINRRRSPSSQVDEADNSPYSRRDPETKSAGREE